MTMSEQSVPYTIALLSGGLAGLAVDVSLYPLDTVKTRLQSKDGFMRTGGFRGIYRGIGPVIVGSVPGASVFFCSYELVKKFGSSRLPQQYDPLIQMVAASVSELFACFVRVPVEVVKQRAQASKVSSYNILKTTLRTEGVRGLYRGYYSTAIREVPFSFLQFPMWEFGKRRWSQYQGHPVDAWQSAICGAVSGGVAAFITNPLDLAKTRIMLAERNSETAKGNVTYALKEVVYTHGLRGLFAGVLPRVMWISIGGAIFLGAYEKSLTLHTDVGDMKMELFCDKVPTASENFLALCASGYYDGCLFHRNIKGFMVQTGDPTGSGKGGQSIWGRKFEDEIDDTLRHNVRGVVSMANNGPDTNGSQFFITYAKQPHLDMKYTIIGKIIDGLEVLDELEKVPVNEKNFRPISEVKLNSVTIHANPIADNAD